MNDRGSSTPLLPSGLWLAAAGVAQSATLKFADSAVRDFNKAQAAPEDELWMRQITFRDHPIIGDFVIRRSGRDGEASLFSYSRGHPMDQRPRDVNMNNNKKPASKSEFFDCKIQAGYYNLAGVDLAHHTYAVAEKDGKAYAMPCFGSFALSENERGNTGVRYPEELWSPSIIWSRQQGRRLDANLSVALGMAQFSLTPRFDWTVEHWDDHWRINPRLNGYSVASWAGLIYGITGVCHQACNRILWSTRMGAFGYGPVNWPPSLSASYWVYGFHGKDAGAAAILATALVVKALLAEKADEGELMKSHALARDVMRNHIEHLLNNHTDGEARAHEVRGMLDHLPPELKISDPAMIDQIVNLDRTFSDQKSTMDDRLYRTANDSFHNEYASKVNDDFRTMLVRFREIMPQETFERLFPDAIDAKNYTLVDRNLMPPDYSRHREGHHD